LKKHVILFNNYFISNTHSFNEMFVQLFYLEMLFAN